MIKDKRHFGRLLAVLCAATLFPLSATAAQTGEFSEEDALGIAKYVLSSESGTSEDCNGDGIINAIDLLIIKRGIIAESTGNSGEFADFSAKWPDKFYSDDTITSDETSYKSRNVNMTVTKESDGVNTWYVMDIYLRSMEHLHGAFANDAFDKTTEWPQTMSENHGAICAINADLYANRSSGIIIRDGVLYRDVIKSDTFVVYKDGTAKNILKGNCDAQAELDAGAWQSYSFGPALIVDGVKQTGYSGYIAGVHPRSGIGYYEPGHYCLVLVDGRQDGYSVGVTLDEFTTLFDDLGCVEAYNLDGGQSSMMLYQQELVNQTYRNGRKTSDIIYISE